MLTFPHVRLPETPTILVMLDETQNRTLHIAEFRNACLQFMATTADGADESSLQVTHLNVESGFWTACIRLHAFPQKVASFNCSRRWEPGCCLYPPSSFHGLYLCSTRRSSQIPNPSHENDHPGCTWDREQREQREQAHEEGGGAGCQPNVMNVTQRTAENSQHAPQCSARTPSQIRFRL